MSSPETTGHEGPPGEPLRARMLDESVRVLGVLPEGDALVGGILAAADRSIDELRNVIADSLSRALDWIAGDAVECGKLFGGYYSGSEVRKTVPAQDRHDVLTVAFDQAGAVVDRFRRAEGQFSGPRPEKATPVQRSFRGWMRGRVSDAAGRYWRHHGRVAASASVGDSLDPTASTPEEQVIEMSAAGDTRAIEVRRRLLRMAIASLSESWASPDILSRKAGAERKRQLDRARSAALRLLTRIEREAGRPEDVHAEPENIAALADECARQRLLEELGTRRETDQPMHRGLRSDVLFAVAGALRVARLRAPESLRKGDPRLFDFVCFRVLELEIALQLAQVEPVVTLLGSRITSDWIGERRFAADLAWLDELLRWLEEETSPVQRAGAAAPALRWLEEVNPQSIRGESPIERAQREIDEDGPKASEALQLLAVHERLRTIVEGYER